MKNSLVNLFSTVPLGTLVAVFLYTTINLSATEKTSDERLVSTPFHYNGPAAPSSEFMNENHWSPLLDTDNYQCAGAQPIPCQIEVPADYNGDIEAYLDDLSTPSAVLANSTKRQSISP